MNSSSITPVSSTSLKRRVLVAALAVVGASIGVMGDPISALPTSVEDLYDPTIVRNLVLDIAPADWDTIRFDTTNTILVPGALTIDGGSPMSVSVRRKSSRALPSEADPRKVGLKIDLPSGNPYGVSKLSLENGGDVSPVAEGLAWALHQVATGAGLYSPDHDPGVAAWVEVSVNGENLGVFTSVEQRNKKFLSNRGWAVADPTWLYEGDDITAPVLEQGPAAGLDGLVPQSPTFEELCYPPFMPATPACPTPSDAVLAARLPVVVDLAAMLTQAAVDAFTANGDALVSKGKNYSFVDRLDQPRRYYPWDLDAVFRGSPTGDGTGANIYAVGATTKRGRTTYTQSPYQRIILNHPQFRVQYNAIMRALLDGPLSVGSISSFLDAVSPALIPALAADPFLGTAVGGDPSGHIDSLRSWVAERVVTVRQQVDANLPAPRAVSRTETSIVASVPPSLRVGTTGSASANLTSLGAGVADVEVTFTINKVTYRGTTNSDGSVSVTFKAPTKAGTYAVVVAFAGTSTLAPASTSVTISIVR